MGNIFEHIEDAEVVKELLGRDINTVEYGDDDLLEKQCGKSLIIEDTFELIPYKVPDNRKTLIGTTCPEVTKWYLTATYVVHSYDRMQPDDHDEIVLGELLDFIEAIEKIQLAMHRWEIDGVMESLYIKNIEIAEKLHPEDAWPECMALSEDN